MVKLVRFRLGELEFSSFHFYQKCPFKNFNDVYNVSTVSLGLLGRQARGEARGPLRSHLRSAPPLPPGIHAQRRDGPTL